MSRTIGMDAIRCRPTPRPAHVEYSMEYHGALISQVTGVESGAGVNSRTASDYALRPREVLRRFYDAWDYDFLWGTHDGFVNWAKAGRCADMGHAVYAADGSDQHEPKACPFSTPEEVWAFDPVEEYGLTPFDELVEGYEKDYQERSAAFPNQVCTGGYYKTVISGAIQAFGWDMLLVAAADEAKFAKVLEAIGRYTLHHAQAWAETSIPVYIQHDDIVWTNGPFLRPDFYREVIFPIYRELWKPLKAAGKKILYCSDGKVDMFLEDIAACGADGFIFEPCNDFDRLVEKLGGTHMLAGSKVDCRTMSFGSWDDVKAEIDATLALTRGMSGHMFAVGNHIPANVSDEMCLRYMNYLRTHWGREQ
ncbi:MAG: uroporphyrinogen decarboxylase family protein [Lentisphaeria bacterium]|nr:uroporphyrinogen decarboxylase family protein [Lentisphaeria bacterium]